MRKSFTTRVFVLHFIVIALPLFVDSLFIFRSYYTQSIENARQYLKQAAEFRSIALAELAPVPQNFLQDLIFVMGLSDDDFSKTQVTFEELKKIPVFANTDFLVSTLPNEQGELKAIAATQPKLLGKTYTNDGSLNRIYKDGGGGAIRYYDVGNGDTHLGFSRLRLIKKNEVPVALLSALIFRDQEVAQVMNTELNLDIDFILSDAIGVILDSTRPIFKGQYLSPLTKEQKNLLIDSNSMGGITLADKPISVMDKDGGFLEFEFENTKYFGYRIVIPEIGGAVIALAPRHQYYQVAAKHLIILSSIYFIVLIIGIILAYFLALWFSRPLRQLNVAMERVKEGDMTKRFTPQPFGYEINIIGNLYNETLEALLNNMKHAENEHVARQKYEKEIELGRRVQENLLSAKIPELERVNTAACYLPAKNVGGDFFCVEQQKTGGLWIAVGDASGKGISSCLYALSARSLLRTYASIYNSIEMICSKTNNDFLKNAGDTGMFVTTLTGIYSPDTSMLSYYSCGHVPGLIRRYDGTLVELSHSGMALGLLESQGYRSDQVQLNRGDVVIFYTKGLVEAINARNQFFSIRRVKELLQHRKWQTAQEIVDGLVDELQNFTMGVEREDEVVIVTFEIV